MFANTVDSQEQFTRMLPHCWDQLQQLFRFQNTMMCLFITKKTYQANVWRTTAVAAYRTFSKILCM